MNNRTDTPPSLKSSGSSAPNSARDRIVRKVILVTGALFIVAMAYGSGMRAKVGEVKRVNETRKVLQTDLRAAELALVARDAQLQQWEARRLVGVALEELDRRNFGIAQERLRDAAARLATAQKAGATTTADLAVQAARLNSIDLPASADVEQQRAQILTVGREMDAALALVAPKPDEIHVVKTERPTANDVPVYGNDVTRVR